MNAPPESPAQDPRPTFRHPHCSRFDLARWAARRIGLDIIGVAEDEPDTLILAADAPQHETAYFAEYRKLINWKPSSD
jgi:hypothetical protein